MIFETTVDVYDNNLWSSHLKVTTTQAEAFIKGKDRRVICRLNDTLEFPCALMPKDGAYYIMLNKGTRSKLKLQEGQKVKVELRKDESEYGMPLAEELKIVFEQDPVAFEYFESLTPGKKRSLLHLVYKVKNPESRITKSLAIAFHLNEVEGKLDFKRLNQTIKDFNSERRLR